MAVDIQAHFSKIIDRVSEGEDVVISRPRRELGFAQGGYQMPSLEEFNAALDPETLAGFLVEK